MEEYEKYLKKLKLSYNEVYSCNFDIKDMFGKIYHVENYSYSFLENETSPLLVCTFNGTYNIYFAIPELIIDKYDKNSIIEEVKTIKNLETYDIKNLKKIEKIIKGE